MSPLFFRKPQEKSASPKPELPWAIKFTGRLLGLQSLVLLGLAIYAAPAPPIPAHKFVELWPSAFYMAMAFLSAWAGLGLLRLRSSAWNLAMLLEGAVLLHALVLYWLGRPFYIYPQMLFGILTVVNLNQSSLRRSFPTELIEAPAEEHGGQSK
jgi:hypothetical protein